MEGKDGRKLCNQLLRLPRIIRFYITAFIFKSVVQLGAVLENITFLVAKTLTLTYSDIFFSSLTCIRKI